MHRIEEDSQTIKYINNIFIKDDQIYKEISATLNKNELRMQILPHEAKILQFLIKSINAKKIIEIGSLAGYSTISMAKSIADDGMIYAFEQNPKSCKIIKDNAKKFNVLDKIKIIEGNAKDSLKKLTEKENFDAIFIDADKAGYCDYLDYAEKLIKKGGLIIADNTLLFGKLLSEDENVKSEKQVEIMNNFNKRLANTKKYSAIMIPTIEGMTIAIKEF